MLEILAIVVEKPILEAIQLSTAIGLEVDESTDVHDQATGYTY